MGNPKGVAGGIGNDDRAAVLDDITVLAALIQVKAVNVNGRIVKHMHAILPQVHGAGDIDCIAGERHAIAPRAVDLHGAGAKHVIGKCVSVAAIDGESAIIGNRPHHAAGSGVVAQLKDAAVDDRAAGEGVGAGEGQCAGATLGEAAGPLDDAADGAGVGVGDDEAVRGEATPYRGARI